MRPLTLLGAGGLTREVLAVPGLVSSRPAVRVLDDDPALWGTELAGVPVEGAISTVTAGGEDDLLVCVGNGIVRRRVVTALRMRGVGPNRFAAVVHPAAVVAPGCRLGAGVVLLAGAVLTADVTVGDHVVVMPQVTLTHDCVVESFATLCAGVSLGGAVRVGSGAYLGMNAVVREHVTVGTDAVLGMGAALLADQPARSVWAGVPARPLRLAEEAVS